MVEDLLFLGEYEPNSGIVPIPGAQRSHTGTQAISFGGIDGKSRFLTPFDLIPHS